MVDDMLQRYAILLEEFAASGMEIGLWVCVSGVTISGMAVSYRRFMEEIEETTNIDVRDPQTGALVHREPLPEHGLTRGLEPVAQPPEYIHLLKPVILGATLINVPWARIRLSEVGAWGGGSPLR